MKLPRNLSASELVKALNKYHYSVERQKGSHIRLTTTLKGQHHITIPNHDPLKIGTLSAILGNVANHLGTTKEEVVQELFS
ncbi:MAG: type II toxin-antitoxin system HicA family toxin [Flavisolibacter sp.]|nr:type II toxin-antitoxin system HicA family toxin [Flavisolibacter sp.]